MTTDYEVVFPDYFQTRPGEVEDKGHTPDVYVRHRAKRYQLSIYDPTRLCQDLATDFATGATMFHEPNVVVVPAVRRADIEAAIAALAELDFAGLSPSSTMS